MKLKVCSRKGKQAFRRAGFSFTPNPIEIDVSEEVAQILKNEAMLVVVELEEEKEEKEEIREMVEQEPEKELKFIPIKRGRPKKK
jgi:hypothetical protein